MESLNWEFLVLLLIRPLIAVLFALSLISTGWLLAWKLVLVHVPLVQEIFGLRKKVIKPKPARRRRLTQFYKRVNDQSEQEIKLTVANGSTRLIQYITPGQK